MRRLARYGAAPGSIHAARSAYALRCAVSSYSTGPWRVYFRSTLTGAAPFTRIVSFTTRMSSHAPRYWY